MSNLSMVPPGPEAPGSDGQPSPNFYRRPGSRPAPAPQTDFVAPPFNPEQRLVIQEDEDTGSFVYTVIDRITGQVVLQSSREEVALMSQRSDYAAGSLIKAKA